MDNDWTTRTALLLGTEGMRRLAASHVLVVGLGGVGAYAAEEIARAGVGRMTLVDADVVSLSNLNRQLPALHSTLGKPKAEVMAARLRDINPGLEIEVRNCFVRDEETEALLDAAHYDFVVDAIDTLSPKTFLIYHASMGAGAKVDPSRIRIADISKTTDCALARAVRKRLRGMGISSGLPVVFSTEPANPQAILEVEDEACKRTTTGTVSLFGCYLASYVIRHLSATD